jgi:cell division protein FtsW (lipid II flippase)
MMLAPLPALCIGVLVMQRSGVNPTIWGQQVAAGLVLMTVCAGMRVALRPTSRSRSWAWAIVGGAALLLLTATLAHSGVEGVRRWVSLGPLQLHAAFVALPVLLIVLCAIVKRESVGSATWIFPFVAGIAAGVLVLQPDASQASAFAVATALVLLQRRRAYMSDWAAGGIVVGSAVLAWSRPDPLETVPHVEGIVGLAASLGAGWPIASALALALLPLPFISDALRHREQRAEGISLAAYFGIVCVAPFVGPYPVPILGYGLSPILGYFAALGWIILRDGAATSNNSFNRTRN